MTIQDIYLLFIIKNSEIDELFCQKFDPNKGRLSKQKEQYLTTTHQKYKQHT